MENPPLEDVFQLNIVIFQCHVSFQVCISNKFGASFPNWPVKTVYGLPEAV